MVDGIKQPISAFSTTDTALAAWLLTKGIIYTNIRFKPNPNRPLDTEAEFVFSANGNELDDLKDAFLAGEAYGNIVSYIRNYHILTQKAKAKSGFR